MDEITKPAELRMQCERLRDFLQATTGQFREGEDSAGVDNLFNSVKELENLVETDRSSPHSQLDLSRLIPILRELDLAIQNQDITGIADLLEDALSSMTEKWLKGCEGT